MKGSNILNFFLKKDKNNNLWKEVKLNVTLLISCFLTGSFITFLPIIFNFCLDSIVGYNINLDAYVADYFLVMFCWS